MRIKIIAEIGYNHNGNIDQAKKLIDQAKKLNLWAVKFQKWNIDGFPDEIKNKERPGNIHNYGTTYYEHRKFLEFDIDTLQKLKEYSESLGLIFICSGKDMVSIKQLVEMGLEWIKIPSQRYHDNTIFHYLFRERTKQNFKIIVSTGMLNGKQIKKSRWKDNDGADVLMHCISLYPAALNICNLAWMWQLNYNGYSSHEIEGKAIKYAVCLGMQYIERHFTLDKNDKGSDHAISSDIKEMKRIKKEINEVEEILGNGTRKITNEEMELGNYYRSF